MHYYTDYSKIEDPVKKQAKAIQDIKDYLGLGRFRKFCMVVHTDQSINRASFIMSLAIFAGIEGYPAEAWADELGLVVDPAELVTKSTETPPNCGESTTPAA